MGLFSRNKEGKQKRDGKKEIENVSSTKIRVKVFKPMGGNIRVVKAEYEAVEQRDEFGELVSINDSTNHKEDVDFQMDSIS